MHRCYEKAYRSDRHKNERSHSRQHFPGRVVIAFALEPVNWVPVKQVEELTTIKPFIQAAQKTVHTGTGSRHSRLARRKRDSNRKAKTCKARNSALSSVSRDPVSALVSACAACRPCGLLKRHSTIRNPLIEVSLGLLDGNQGHADRHVHNTARVVSLAQCPSVTSQTL
jgi:hypothetical protein